MIAVGTPQIGYSVSRHVRPRQLSRCRARVDASTARRDVTARTTATEYTRRESRRVPIVPFI